MDVNLFTNYNIKDPKTILAGHTIDELDVNFKIKQKDLNAYNPPNQSELDKGNIEVHYMSYYRKWVPQENYYYSVKNTFFEQRIDSFDKNMVSKIYLINKHTYILMTNKNVIMMCCSLLVFNYRRV